MELTDLDQSQHIFSLMGQIVTTLGFVRHMVSVVTPQLCHYSAKAARDNTCMHEQVWLCANKTLFAKSRQPADP